MSKLAYERMRDSLEQFHLGRALETVDALLERAAAGEITTVDLLDQLLTAELALRRERSIAMRLKLAGLPAVKTLERFDLRSNHRSTKKQSATYIRFASWLMDITFSSRTARLRENALGHESPARGNHCGRARAFHDGA